MIPNYPSLYCISLLIISIDYWPFYCISANGLLTTAYIYNFFALGQKIDSPLSEIGIQQSEAAGRYLGDVKFTNVFVSDMKRAKQVSRNILVEVIQSGHR